MANNRLYLCCIKCLQDDNKELSDCIFFMFKYYPNTGWYATPEEDEAKVKWVDNTNNFLNSHWHSGEFDSWEEGMYGRFISIFEAAFDPMAQDKIRIAGHIRAGFDKLNAK